MQSDNETYQRGSRPLLHQNSETTSIEANSTDATRNRISSGRNSRNADTCPGGACSCARSSGNTIGHEGRRNRGYVCR